MAALTADRSTLFRGEPGPIHHIPATAATQFFKGGLVGIQQSTGLLVKPVITDGTVVIAGICLDNVLSGASGATLVRVRGGKDQMVKLVNGQTIANATDRGKIARVSDDQTVQLTTDASAPIVGTVYEVDSDGVWVTLAGPDGIAAPTNLATGS